MAVVLGVDHLFDGCPEKIAGRRIGLVTHYGMTDGALIPVIDRFLRYPDARLAALFGPEHGVQNCAREGEPVAFQIDGHSRLPAFSLYGDVKAPTRDMLSDIDLLVIDLQDIGSRYYTNISTVYYCLEAGAATGTPVMVLDRPNPIGGLKREGYPLDPAYRSFVGIAELPHRHGMTIGEIARWMARVYWPQAELTVIPLAGWDRRMAWEDTGLPFVSPSPNTTGPAMALLYPGMCLFEGTNLSLGRGTVHPFEWIGAPWIDGHRLANRFNARAIPGVVARPAYFVPNRPPYAGEICQGVQLHVTEPDRFHSLASGIVLMAAVQALYPDRFAVLSAPGSVPFFDLLAGGPLLRELLAAGRAEDFLQDEPEAVARFTESVSGDLLYA